MFCWDHYLDWDQLSSAEEEKRGVQPTKESPPPSHRRFSKIDLRADHLEIFPSPMSLAFEIFPLSLVVDVGCFLPPTLIKKGAMISTYACTYPFQIHKIRTCHWKYKTQTRQRQYSGVRRILDKSKSAISDCFRFFRLSYNALQWEEHQIRCTFWE